MNTGSALAQFTITLSQAVTEPVQVDWFTSDGTAKAGVDYAANKGTVVFSPGQTEKTVDILVYGRAVGAEDRSFFVEMLPPTNAILGAAIGECIITVDTSGSTPVTQIIVPTGPQGIQGKSAYQSYLDTTTDNPPMTEAEWVESLKGDPAEIAQEVAPLIDVGNTMLTAEGTDTLGKPDSTTVKAIARRIAYAAPAKIATVTLASGDNAIGQSDMSGDVLDMSSEGLYPRILRSGSFSEPVWSIRPDGKLLIKNAIAGDVLYVCQYDLIARKKQNTNTRELWRRSLAEAGLTLVDGSFEDGATVNSMTEAVWHIAGGQCYVWSGAMPKAVTAGENPAGNVNWVPQTDHNLRSDLAATTSGKGADLVKFKTGNAVQRLVDSDGFNIIGKFAQVADLRSVAASAGTTVLVKEHTTGRGALGGGQFVAVAATIADDDGVYISSGTAEVTWVRKDAGSHVKIEWFGGKSEDFSIDHSPILANAQKSEGRSIEFQYGTYCFTPPCTIKPSMHFIGAGGARTFWRNKNLTADANVFRADTGTQSSWASDTIFERIHFSNGVSAPVTNAVLIMVHTTLFKFINCGFYNAPIYASNLHWVTWSGCQFIDSPVRIDEQQVSPTFPINEGPSFIDCYMVRSPIDIVDVADLHLNGTSMFYGPYGIKSTAHRPLDSGATSRGFPMMITNSTIDNTDGYCLDLNRVAVGTITNSFFSGGRVSNTAAIKATEILGLSFNSNVIHFAGQECMYLYDTENMLMGNNQFSSCNGFAIKAQYSRNNVLNGNFFGTQKVSGGWNTCTGGVNFDTNDNLAWQITGNVFAGGIPGVAGQVGTGRTVYRATGNAGLADN